jgi:hypothetical protein
MEINITFTARNFSETARVLSSLLSELAQAEAYGDFGDEGNFTVRDTSGETIATYSVIDSEVDPESFTYPFNCIDYSDDAEALASAGLGTDEDYGYYGGYDEW